MATRRTFADMTPGARDSWISWARDHDWGRRAVIRGAFLSCLDEVNVDAGGAMTIDSAQFDNPADLRAWAGY